MPEEIENNEGVEIQEGIKDILDFHQGVFDDDESEDVEEFDEEEIPDSVPEDLDEPPAQEPAPEIIAEEDGVEDRVPDAPVDQGDPVESREEILLRQIEDLSARLEQVQTQSTQPPVEEKKDFGNFFEENEMDDVLTDPKKLSGVLTQVAQSAYNRAIEDVKKNVPSLVNHMIHQQFDVRDKVGSFFSKNSDLNPVQTYVHQLAGQIYQQNPDKSFEDVYSEAAVQTRQALGIRSESMSPAQSRPAAQKPPLPSKGSSRGNKSNNPGGIPPEMADIIALRR